MFSSVCLLYLWQSRTIASAAFSGSFVPILRFETFEIHPVFLHISNLGLEQNLPPNALVELYGFALKRRAHKRPPRKLLAKGNLCFAVSLRRVQSIGDSHG
ncbi:MAG: hypothetical protein J7E02_23370, partial [Escherichia coli]|nr:hypothetical protein [Escherichia coli]